MLVIKIIIGVTIVCITGYIGIEMSNMLKAREEILKVHARGKTFAKNVNLENIAKRTVGFSGADLENLLCLNYQ